MKVENIQKCSFSSWYPTFQAVTFESVCLPVDDIFLNYLLSDGLFLPNNGGNWTYLDAETDSEPEIDWDSDSSSTSNGESERHIVEDPELQRFFESIDAAILALGGAVLPKLNWSSPKDAVWIAPSRCLKCCSAADVCLLLKSSDFITHDLSQPFDMCEDRHLGLPAVQYELVLRQWHDVNPSSEFRCFVRDRRLIGISQRDYRNFYPYIIRERERINEDIVRLFLQHIRDQFDEDCYTFDVIWRPEGRLLIVDFNPFGRVTDALLFDWEELEEVALSAGAVPELRFLTENPGILGNEFGCYRVPRDLVDIGRDMSRLAELVHEQERDEPDPCR